MMYITDTQLAANDGASLVGYCVGQIGAVDRSVEDRLREKLSVKDFGAVGDGSTDDSSEIQAAINAAVALGIGIVEFPSATYRIDNGLILDTNAVGLLGNGSTLDFSNVATEDDLFTITHSVVDPNASPTFNCTKGIHGFRMVGPGPDVTDVRAIVLDSATDSIAYLPIENCSFIDFSRDIHAIRGAFDLCVRGCIFTISTGAAAPETASIDISAGVNAGERNLFESCGWANRNFILDQSQSNATTFFVGCTLAYAQRFMTITAGSVDLSSCHIESSADTTNWFYVEGEDTHLRCRGSSLIVTDVEPSAPKTDYAPFYSHASCTSGGVELSGLRYAQTRDGTTKLVDGAGRVVHHGLSFYTAGNRPAISEYSSQLAYGDFENANALAGDGWVRSDPSKVDRCSSSPLFGGHSLRIEGVVGVTQSAALTRSARPGQFVAGELYYNTSALAGSSGTFVVAVFWIDKAGNTLGGTNVVVETTTVSSPTRALLAVTSPAPKGTASVQLAVALFGVESGAPFARVDNVIFDVV